MDYETQALDNLIRRILFVISGIVLITAVGLSLWLLNCVIAIYYHASS